MNLKEYLLKNKITQRDFAKMLGSAGIHIHYVVNGKRPPGMDLAYRIRDLTGGEVDLPDLFAGIKRKCCPTCGQIVSKK